MFKMSSLAGYPFPREGVDLSSKLCSRALPAPCDLLADAQRVPFMPLVFNGFSALAVVFPLAVGEAPVSVRLMTCAAALRLA